MSESGGRRIKRASAVDVATIRFVDRELLSRLKGIRLLRPYLEQKTREVGANNRAHVSSEEIIRELNWNRTSAAV